MKRLSPCLVLVVLLALVFTLATYLMPRKQFWERRARNGDPLTMLMGEGRQLFANYFFTKADVYFHAGYYPSMFDQASKEPSDAHHLLEDHKPGEKDNDEEEAHEKRMSIGQPTDWLDRFSRNFFPSTHMHLDKPGESREILPWLRISASLDPQRVETYVVAAYWLRKHLNKVNEAEQFLREGLRANPQNPDLTYNLGLLYYEDRHDSDHARNLLELALRRWDSANTAGEKPDVIVRQGILINLADLEEKQGNYSAAIRYKELELKDAPFPDLVKKQIADLQSKLTQASARTSDGNAH